MLNITAVLALNTIAGHFTSHNLAQNLPKHLFRLLLYKRHINYGIYCIKCPTEIWDLGAKESNLILLCISRECKILFVLYFEKRKFSKYKILLFSLWRTVLYLFTFCIHMWVCKYIKYLGSYYAIWKSLQHLNFTIRLDIFNEVKLTFERFRLSDKAAGKDKRHRVVYFLLPVIKTKSLPSCV